MEALVLPLRSGAAALLRSYEYWFQQARMLPINRDVFRRAAQLRADFAGLKTPDATHLAIALHHRCDQFWTNDSRLDQIAPNLVKNIASP